MSEISYKVTIKRGTKVGYVRVIGTVHNYESFLGGETNEVPTANEVVVKNAFFDMRERMRKMAEEYEEHYRKAKYYSDKYSFDSKKR